MPVIPEKLKLNKFRLVNLPRNKDYFARYGVNQMPDKSYSGEEVLPMNSRKTDQLYETQMLYEQMMAEEDRKRD